MGRAVGKRGMRYAWPRVRVAGVLHRRHLHSVSLERAGGHLGRRGAGHFERHRDGLLL